MERRILELLEKLFSKIDGLSDRLTSIESGQKSFWSREWPSLTSQINSNSLRITELEMELAKLKTKIAISGAIVVFLLTSGVAISTAYITKEQNEKKEAYNELLGTLRQFQTNNKK